MVGYEGQDHMKQIFMTNNYHLDKSGMWEFESSDIFFFALINIYFFFDKIRYTSRRIDNRERKTMYQ